MAADGSQKLLAKYLTLIISICPSQQTIGENMGLDKLIAIGATMAVLAVSTGQLSKAIIAVHIAQLQLIKDSQASKWPMAELLPKTEWYPIKHK